MMSHAGYSQIFDDERLRQSKVSRNCLPTVLRCIHIFHPVPHSGYQPHTFGSIVSTHPAKHVEALAYRARHAFVGDAMRVDNAV